MIKIMKDGSVEVLRDNSNLSRPRRSRIMDY